jgi:ornithine carbamoyltransferase
MSSIKGLKGRSFLTLKDFSADEIRSLLDLSFKVKQEKKRGKNKQRFAGSSLALIFEKRSTRTRCAFETAFGEEGGHPVFLSMSDIQLGAKESIEDTARVLGRMFEALQYRGFDQKIVDTLARYSGVPVYNGLTDAYHPTQALADLMTIEEASGGLAGKRVAFVGDARNNVAHSLMIGCSKMGVHYASASPRDLLPAQEVVTLCEGYAQSGGSTITVTEQPEEAVKDADVVYTDVWASMGEEAKLEERKKILEPYRVDETMMRRSDKEGTVFMHCLPAVKGNEVTAEVIDGPRSKAWDQAENRKHTIKAIMLATIL